MSWKWSGNRSPATLKNRLVEYSDPKQLREEYDREMQTWINNGWLFLYPKGLIPLMVVRQENK